MVTEKPASIIVRVQPNARRNEIVRFVGSTDSPRAEGVWYLKIAAPAVEGKANKALVRFLSEVLDVSKTSLSIKLGTMGRQKVVKIAGLTQEQITERLKNRLETED